MKKEIYKFKNIHLSLIALRWTIQNEELAFPLPGNESEKAIQHLKQLEAICVDHIEFLEISLLEKDEE